MDACLDRSNSVEPDNLERLAKAASVARLATLNLAPEASQVHQLTTFEVLTALNSNPDQRPSAAEDSAVETLIVPERARWWQRLRHWMGENIKCLRAFLYRNIPHGLKNNRLGIQWTCIGFVVMSLEFISPPEHEFWGPCWLSFANFVAINALTTIEMATGATNRNAWLRILGTTLAAIISFAVLVPMVLVGWEGEDDSYMVRWIMYYACTPSPFIWNFFVYHYPTYMHENFTFQGLSTQVYLFGSNSKKIVWDMFICTIGCYAGTIVGFVGYQLVVPLRARDKLTQDISLISYKLSYSLEPLIEFESGTKTQKPRHTISKLPLLAKSLSKVREWRAGGSKGNLAARGSRIMQHLSVRFGVNQTSPLNPPQDDLDKFKSRVWDTLADCAKLMENHEEVLAHARREHYYSKPHTFHYKHFKKLSGDCMALYYHISSLFLIFQAQMSTTPTQATYNDLPKLVPHSRDFASSGADFGGLFVESSRINPSEHSQSNLNAARSQILSPPSLSLNSLEPSEAELPNVNNKLSPPGVLSVPLVSNDPVMNVATTADGVGAKMYTPLEALSASKITKHDIIPKADPGILKQLTMPMLTKRKSTLLIPTHAASVGVIANKRFSSSDLDDQAAPLSHRSGVAKDSVKALSPPPDNHLAASMSGHSRRQEMEMREALLEAAQEEKNDVMDSLANIKNLMLGEDGSLLVPDNAAARSRELLPPPSLGIPTPAQSSSPGGTPSRRGTSETVAVHVGGELDILVSAPSDHSEEAPIASAKVIGLAPVVKWAEVFGPMFGELAENMGHVLELIGECLDYFRWNTKVWDVVRDAESSLARLVAARRNWWQVSQEIAALINSNLYRQDCVADQGMYDEFEEKFCIPWLGLTLDAYGRLPAAVKDDLWVSFENMQDRQTMAVKTCEALIQRLKLFAHSAHSFLAVQFPITGTEPIEPTTPKKRQVHYC